jgi:hypothetical protein
MFYRPVKNKYIVKKEMSENVGKNTVPPAEWFTILHLCPSFLLALCMQYDSGIKASSVIFQSRWLKLPLLGWR